MGWFRRLLGSQLCSFPECNEEATIDGVMPMCAPHAGEMATPPIEEDEEPIEEGEEVS